MGGISWIAFTFRGLIWHLHVRVCGQSSWTQTRISGIYWVLASPFSLVHSQYGLKIVVVLLLWSSEDLHVIDYGSYTTKVLVSLVNLPLKLILGRVDFQKADSGTFICRKGCYTLLTEMTQGPMSRPGINGTDQLGGKKGSVVSEIPCWGPCCPGRLSAFLSSPCRWCCFP